jgi:hypothetical protein
MKCPFCAEEVKDDAVVCKHCRYDLTVVRGLLGRIQDLTRRMEGNQPDQIAAVPEPAVPQRQDVSESFRDSLKASLHVGAHERVGILAGAIERRMPLVSPLTTLLLALGALLLAHFLIVVHYDVSLIWLHIASLIIPFIFGFVYRQNTTEYLSGDLAAGLLLAAVAIFAMSAVVAEVDKVPVLPTDLEGWLEYLEYGASIALAFFAGAVCRQTAIAMSAPAAKTSRLVYFAARYATAKVSGVAPHDPHDPHMDRYLKRLGFAERVITATIAGGSALISIWSGLGHFM